MKPRESSVTLNQLPEEMLIEMGMRLDSISLAALAQTSKEFRRIFHDNRLWEKKARHHFPGVDLRSVAGDNNFLKFVHLYKEHYKRFSKEQRTVISRLKEGHATAIPLNLMFIFDLNFSNPHNIFAWVMHHDPRERQPIFDHLYRMLCEMEEQYRRRGIDPFVITHTTRLFWAAACNQPAEVERLLAENPGAADIRTADTQMRHGEGWTPLDIAAYCGHEGIVDTLMPVTTRSTKYRCVASRRAVQGNQPAIAKKLLADEAQHWRGHSQTLEELPKSRMSETDYREILTTIGVLDLGDEHAPLRQLMIIAVQEGNLPFLRVVDAANAAFRRFVEKRLLHTAASCDNTAFVFLLSTLPAPIPGDGERFREATRGERGRTLLHRAALWRNVVSVEIARKLLDYEESVCTPDDDGRSPIAIAAEEATKSDDNVANHILKLFVMFYLEEDKRRRKLTAASAEQYIPPVTPRTLLYYAAMCDAETMSAVLAAYPITREDLDHRHRLHENTEDTATVLHVVAERGDAESVTLLLAKGMAADVYDSKGFTPIYAAASEGHLSVVKLLVAAGASLKSGEYLRNTARYQGDTVLHWAAWKRDVDLELIRYLVEEQQLDRDIEMYMGMFRPHSLGMTPLHCAASASNTDVCCYLVERRLHINATDFEKCTPLHYAASLRDGYRRGLVTALLERGANPVARDKNGDTPLQCASQPQMMEMVEFITQRATAGDRASKKVMSDIFRYLRRDVEWEKIKLLLKRGIPLNDEVISLSLANMGQDPRQDREIVSTLFPNLAAFDVLTLKKIRGYRFEDPERQEKILCFIELRRLELLLDKLKECYPGLDFLINIIQNVAISKFNVDTGFNAFHELSHGLSVVEEDTRVIQQLKKLFKTHFDEPKDGILKTLTDFNDHLAAMMKTEPKSTLASAFRFMSGIGTGPATPGMASATAPKKGK